jgi:carbon starvation protein CstA
MCFHDLLQSFHAYEENVELEYMRGALHGQMESSPCCAESEEETQQQMQSRLRVLKKPLAHRMANSIMMFDVLSPTTFWKLLQAICTLTTGSTGDKVARLHL